uniref:Uncharacterized protein n=1 Tax=Dendroctonus ponderosae TaxID=77166 RepID=J3JV69_DENPD|nr:unknown [Dendroctonus ponderosae]
MANELEKKIIRQIEFYFGDINLPRDKFLLEKVKEDEGWVSLETMLKFNRLANLSKDLKVIADALEKSEEKVVVLNDDKTKVKRNPEKQLPDNNDERLAKLREKSAYAKGFPLDAELNDIIDFMDQYGPIESVIRRTHSKEHQFKGSCFIVFKTIELAKKFVELDGVKFKDLDLIRKMQNDYFADKKKKYEERKKLQKEKQNAVLKESAEKIEFPNGAILHFSGIPEGQQLTREEIKEKITEASGFDVVYIDFNKGDLEGYVRFAKENNAAEFFKTLTEGELQIGENKLKARALEGDEEKEYLKKTSEAMATQRIKQKSYGRKRKGNFGGGKNAKHSKKQ